MTTRLYVIRFANSMKTIDRIDLDWAFSELPKIGDVIDFEPSENPADLYGYEVIARIWFPKDQPPRTFLSDGSSLGPGPGCRMQLRVRRVYDPPPGDAGYV